MLTRVFKPKPGLPHEKCTCIDWREGEPREKKRRAEKRANTKNRERRRANEPA